MPAPLITLAPTLGGILGGLGAAAGKEILKAFLAQKFGSLFQQPEEQAAAPSPFDEARRRRREQRPATFPGIPANWSPTAPQDHALADDPILRAFMNG